MKRQIWWKPLKLMAMGNICVGIKVKSTNWADDVDPTWLSPSRLSLSSSHAMTLMTLALGRIGQVLI